MTCSALGSLETQGSRTMTTRDLAFALLGALVALLVVWVVV